MTGISSQSQRRVCRIGGPGAGSLLTAYEALFFFPFFSRRPFNFFSFPSLSSLLQVFVFVFRRRLLLGFACFFSRCCLFIVACWTKHVSVISERISGGTVPCFLYRCCLLSLVCFIPVIPRLAVSQPS